MNSPMRLGFPPTATTPSGFFQPEVLQLYFPMQEPWIMQSVLLPSCSSRFICTQMWDCLLCQPLTHPPWSSNHHLAVCSLHPSCLSLPLLQVWMNVSSLTPWLSDFHTVLFSCSSGYFFFLNLLLSFWLCNEAKCIHAPSWLEILLFHFFKKVLYCCWNTVISISLPPLTPPHPGS